MPVVVVGRGDIGPASASQSPEDADTSNELWENAVRSCGKDIPQRDQEETGACILLLAHASLPLFESGLTRSDGNEDLEDGSFGIAVADGGRDGWEPLNGVALDSHLADGHSIEAKF